MFYGVLIRMFFRDTEKHFIPHIHADYQGLVGVYSIPDGILLAGELTPNKHKLVVAWIEIHRDDLRPGPGLLCRCHLPLSRPSPW